MKKLFVSLVSLLFVVTLASCVEKCDHVDSDNDNTCDKCYLVLSEKHEHTFVEGVCDCGEIDPDYVAPHEHEYVDGKCECGEKDPNYVNPDKDSIKDQYECISISEAIEIATNAGSTGTAEQYYIYGVVEEVKSAMYGEMTISDETGSIYVYGVYSADGTVRYDAMEERPVAGDEVVLLAKLKTYNGTPELDRAYLQAFTHVEKELDLSDYPQEDMNMQEVRNAEAGTLVRVTGVVAHITYAFGMNPNGFYLVNETGSIYVYSNQTPTLKVGNEITIVGEKTYYVLETEQASANKYGYKGSCQIQDIIIVSNDKGQNEYDLSWVEETTVKEILDTEFTENITTTIYKVNALVRKDDRGSFVNYYFEDLDGLTGSYTYTACSGADFAWLDEFDGKVCTVYLSPMNAKATNGGCIWRFMPIKVVDEGFTFDQSKGAEFVAKYFVLDHFLNKYEADPETVLPAVVDNSLTNIIGAVVSYSSSDSSILYFEKVENTYVLHTDKAGTVTVTITVEYAGKTSQYELVIEVVEPVVYETISIAEAYTLEDGVEVILRGIVASSLVNQDGFYLIDETGIMAIIAPAEQVALLSSGDEVVIKGTKAHRVKDDYLGAGQINIDDSTILANYYGNHEYDTSNFDTTKTLNDLYTYDHMEDHSNEVYVVQAVVKVEKSYYYTAIKILSPDGKVSMSLYCSSAEQYGFLKQYDGKEVTLELALCNWNSKDYYAGCVISVTYEGVKTVNTLNFNE